MNILKIISISVLMMTAGCDATKSSTSTEKQESENTIEMKSELIQDGYSYGKIIYDEKSSCPYIIEDQQTKEMLDPINFNEEKFAGMRNAGDMIYFKCQRLRRMNRCPDAAPIQLTEIKME